MKLLSTVIREGGSVNREWVSGSSILYREHFGILRSRSFTDDAKSHLLNSTSPNPENLLIIIYSGLTHCSYVRTFEHSSKDFWVKPTLTHFSFSVLGGRFGIRFTVGGGYE